MYLQNKSNTSYSYRQSIQRKNERRSIQIITAAPFVRWLLSDHKVEGLLLSLSSTLRSTPVVLIQQLHTATKTFGSVNMCMLNTDLNSVCGASQPRDLLEQTGGEQGRFQMDTVSLKSYSRPVVQWRQVSGRDVLTMCVLISPVAETHTQRAESQPLSRDQTLLVGSVFTIRPDVLSALQSSATAHRENSDTFDEKAWNHDGTGSFKTFTSHITGVPHI